jgi:hypothetical protein
MLPPVSSSRPKPYHLSLFDRIKIEAAINRAAEAGRPHVRIAVEHNGRKYRVLMYEEIDKQQMLADRAAADN